MKLRITFKKGLEVVAEVNAVRPIDRDHTTVADMERIIETEQWLEKMTGLRVHIEQVAE